MKEIAETRVRYGYRRIHVLLRRRERVCGEVGYPASIRVDQGSEFISRELDFWAYTRNVTLDFSQPGKPTDNAFVEPFNGKFRAECERPGGMAAVVGATAIGKRGEAG